MFLELVVARYQEDLRWLRNIPPQIRVTVYDKSGEEAAASATRLPNVGREAHTYLHHIVTRYETLSPLTVFCQGKPFDHAFDFHAALRVLAREPQSAADFRWLGHIIDTDDACGRRLFVPWSKNPDGHELEMDAFHRALFGTGGPLKYTFRLGAQFAVTSETIRARPRDFYERALRIATSFPDAAHCFERTWDKVFGMSGADDALLAGRETLYLKPVRRLQNEG